MELAYQGLFIRLPFEGAVGVEAFEMNASFNDHVTLRPVSYTHLDVYKRQLYIVAGV